MVADGWLTNVLIEKGIASEGNPFLYNIAGHFGFLIIKLVGVLLAALILWDINRRYPKVAFWTASFFLLAYAGIVGWNLYLLLAAG